MDCMEGMAQTKDKEFCLSLVDPPYGNNDAIGIVNGNGHAAKRKNYELFKNIAPKAEYFKELKRVSKHQIIWGGNWFGLKGGYLCWNKNGTAFGEAELAYCSMFNSVRIYEFTWNGMLQGDMKNKEVRIHPTQKPIQLYRWIYATYLPTGGKVIDTHLGSQSNRIAAYDRGNIDFTAYETDPDYFAEGNARFERHRIKCEELKELGFAKTELSLINPTLF